MVKNFVELSKTLEEKLSTLVEAVKSSDATTSDYKDLLENIAATLTLNSNLNRTLIALEAQQKSNEEGEK